MATPLSPPRILVVEDDSAIAEGIVRGLRGAGFEVELVQDGSSGAERGLRPIFDLIVLDLMLPEIDGFSLLEIWRSRIATPVIVLTAMTDLDARLRAFGGGAVDYITKPFWIEELVARIHIRLQTRDSLPAKIITWDDVEVDLNARTVKVAQHPVAFTSHEFNVLAYLAERPGRTITRQLLAQHALSASGDVNDRTVDSHLARVRKKLGHTAAARIVTVWGIGYRFDPQETP
jgi:DNA-binding response OmpR family regulator